eukprot:CAMPEP_0197499246 /NCGR_PEP_ID=MMETSP1311-20131121/60922_1 /TAXON_ID=464262 /ORGANISM="Genus nov. species nov., Strain RCC856" /LENGTH=416 /DNA_ID=CAMNT_0043044989 /DNA_START=41 /DNA_END=1291 /DNA_ORIENTATION=+
MTLLSGQRLPLQGQGTNPDEPVTIYVSAINNRLVDVDDKNSRFENLLFLQLSWRDARAKRAMRDSTLAFRNGTLDKCNRPCTSSWDLARDESQTFAPQDSCCDNVWLPALDMTNVFELPTGRLQPYQIFVDEDSDAVAWMTAIHGKYFAEMSFRSFPFDSQKLVMQFGYLPKSIVSAFVPSSATTRFLVREEGEIVSGWDVEDIKVVPKNTTQEIEASYFLSEFGTSPPNPDDPAPVPIVSAGVASDAELVSFDVEIRIVRMWKYYILNMFLPLFLLVALSFSCYLTPPESLDVRVSLQVTLFLSLTAYRFIITDALPQSSQPNSLTNLIIVYYFCISFGIPQSVVVYMLCDSSRARDEMMPPAKRSTEGRGKVVSTALKMSKREHSGELAALIDLVSLAAVMLVVIIGSTCIMLG